MTGVATTARSLVVFLAKHDPGVGKGAGARAVSDAARCRYLRRWRVSRSERGDTSVTLGDRCSQAIGLGFRILQGLLQPLFVCGEFAGTFGRCSLGGKQPGSFLGVTQLLPQRGTLLLEVANRGLRNLQLRLVIRPSRNPTIVAPTMKAAISVTA